MPIGVFDSGLGGLTIVRELRKKLPNEKIAYFGDIARLPYGIKSKEQIQRFSIENTEFLLTQKIKALVVACNSSSSAAYGTLKRQFNIPIIDVIEPAVREAVACTKSRRVGIVGTQATIESEAYARALKKALPGARIFSEACPLFVPLVEEGRLQGPITDAVVREYLTPFKKNKVDTLILGCTHYPLLKAAIGKFMGPRVRLVDSAGPCVRSLAKLLVSKRIENTNNRKGPLHIFVSDLPRNFVRVGQRFLRERMSHIRLVR